MISKRKKKSLINIAKKTRFDRSLLKFTYNFIRHLRASYKKGKDRDIPYPTTIMLELTNKCNLHCVTCPREYGFGKNMRLGNMDTALAKKIIDEVLPYIESIGLTGMGETLFATNLLEIVRYIKARKPSVVIAISTNFNIPDAIERIKPVLPFIDTVQISIDGITDVYERIRHGASFGLLKKNLETLVPLAEGLVSLMFNMVITKLNYSDMANVIKFADKNGVRFVNFTYFNLASITDISEEYYGFFHSEEFARALEAAKKAAGEHPEVEVTGLDFPGNPGIRKCPLMWNHFQVNYDGKVPPCCAKPFTDEYSFGDASEMPLISVLNSPAAKKFRNSWIENRPNGFCSKCHFVKL